MKAWLRLCLLVCAPGLLLAQSSTVYIYDSTGNSTTATINGGSFHLYDSNGNSATGTIRDGHVYMNGSHGEYTFGTIKDGHVFLTDQAGNTTGSIRNGYILLNNSDGSTTTGTYDSFGHVFTTTTPSVEQRRQLEEIQREQQRQAQERQQQLNQQNYETGQQIGQSIGNAIGGAVQSHHITTYCKSNPTGSAITSDGITIQCPDAPLSDWEKQQAGEYCADHPGLWIEFGRHRVDCLTPPNPANLQWAKWEIKNWQWDYRNQAKAKMQIPGDQIKSYWSYWLGVYCQLAPRGSSYKDLDNNKQNCQ